MGKGKELNEKEKGASEKWMLGIFVYKMFLELREILRLEVRVCRVQCFSYNLINLIFYSFHLFMAKNYVKNHVQKSTRSFNE